MGRIRKPEYIVKEIDKYQKWLAYWEEKAQNTYNPRIKINALSRIKSIQLYLNSLKTKMQK